MDLVVHQEFLQQRGDPVADEAAMGGHRIQVFVSSVCQRYLFTLCVARIY